MDKNKIFYTHLFNKNNNKGGFTLAFTRYRDDEVCVGIAKCRENESFVKFIGRQHSLTRLKELVAKLDENYIPMVDDSPADVPWTCRARFDPKHNLDEVNVHDVERFIMQNIFDFN